MSNNSSPSVSIGFPGLLTLVFIVLKLLDKIDWSWVWVLSPLWISGSLVILVMLIAFLVILFRN